MDVAVLVFRGPDHLSMVIILCKSLKIIELLRGTYHCCVTNLAQKEQNSSSITLKLRLKKTFAWDAFLSSLKKTQWG